MKKLSIKTKGDKLVIHKEAVDTTPDTEEEELPFDPDPPEKNMKAAKPKAKPKTKVGKKVVANIDIAEKDGKEITSMEEEEIVVGEVESTSEVMANVGFGIARTINLGNFESVKVQVDIHVPSEVTEDEIEGNYEFAKGWCEEKMDEIVSAYVEDK